jgi:hypothetical protein
MEIIDNLVNAPVTGAPCPIACSQAWGHTADLPDNRDLPRYQAALGQIQTAVIDIGGLTNALRGLLPALEQAIDVPYVNDYLPNAEQRVEEERQAREEDLRQAAEQNRREKAAKIRRTMDEQKTKLEGTLKNRNFVYYQQLVVRSALEGVADHLNEQHVLILEDGNGAFREFSTGRCLVGTIVEKGTHKLTRDKYFKFRCTGLSKQDMWDALHNTGWNMSNLNRADKLELVH